MTIRDLIARGAEGRGLTRDQTVQLLRGIRAGSDEQYLAMSAAASLSRRTFQGGEVHAQLGVNFGPCSMDCEFCVFGEKHGLAGEPLEMSPDEAAEVARRFVNDGAHAVYLMDTADFPFDRFLAVGRAVREAIGPELPLVANTGDFGEVSARRLRETGFTGIYHVRRLGEGAVSRIPPEHRLRTMQHARAAGLEVLSCLEPIGPEHGPEQLADVAFQALDAGVTMYATMRRIPVPGTALAAEGMIPEAELARITAVIRLAAGDRIRGMGVHEPNVASLMAGANVLYAEAGPNPRDTRKETSEGRGRSVSTCRTFLWDAGHDVRARSALAPRAWDREVA
ncbi:MAG TPA: radical SAM protein [Anaeromyxobacter sp.]|jgi:biotin synthase|nr:radical SAM protein [Anaeromyxobacter sp.]